MSFLPWARSSTGLSGLLWGPELISKRDHEGSPRRTAFRPRWMHLRRAVYRAAAFHPTLIKHFKCSYRNRVTNPNSTLLTERRLCLQIQSKSPFMGKAAQLASAERLQWIKRRALTGRRRRRAGGCRKPARPSATACWLWDPEWVT